ncbi:MAG: alginate export family protein [Verrucomicrobiota bacterium]
MAAPAHPPISAGLVNDWLRRQSAEFKAWDMGGQVRAQFDVKANHGSFPDSTPDRDFIRNGVNNDDNVLYLREKIHLGYHRDWVQFFVEGRDSTTTGDDRTPHPFSDRFDLQQACVTVGRPNTFPLSLQVGRQQLSYGDERFVETADWSNVERTFDAVKLRYESEWFWMEGFTGHYVLPDDGRFNESNWNDWFSGVYLSTRRLIPRQETQVYLLARNTDAHSANRVTSSGAGAGARDVYTIGARVKSLPGQFGGWDYGAEIAGQIGDVKQGPARVEHRALMADVMGGYTWTNAPGLPRVGLDFTYGSGDSDPTDSQHETFDLLFGAAHKYYGIMDVTGLRNTISPSLNLTLRPIKKVTLRLDYFLYWLADTHDLAYAEVGKGRTVNGYGVHPNFNQFFGSEIDLVANYALTPYLNLQAGYSHFFVGDYVRQSVSSVAANGGAVDADFLYVQAKFNF